LDSSGVDDILSIAPAAVVEALSVLFAARS